MMSLLKLKNINKDVKQIEEKEKHSKIQVKNSKKVENFYTQVSNNLPLSTASQSHHKPFQPFFQNEQDIYHRSGSSEQRVFSASKEVHSNLNIKQYLHSDQYPIKENISSEFERQTHHSRKESKFFYANEFIQQKSLSEICHKKNSKISPQLFHHKNISPPEKQLSPKFFHVNESLLSPDHYLLSQNSNLPAPRRPVQLISKDNYDESSITSSGNKTPPGSPPGREVKSTHIKSLSNIQYINDTFSINNEIEKSPQSIHKTSKIPLRHTLVEESDYRKFARTNRKVSIL